MQNVTIKIEPWLCTGCRTCEIVCSLRHSGRCDPRQARIIITTAYDQSLIEPHVCQLCDSPDCIDACPTGSLTQDARTKSISFDPEHCSGCQACVTECPHGAIRWDDIREMVCVCDRCDGEALCVQFCLSGALQLATQV